MSKWLIKYYPVEPAQSLLVYNIDVLNIEDYGSKFYQELVHLELKEYKAAIGRNGISSNGHTSYNDEIMALISAEKVSDAIQKFFKGELK